MNKQRNTIILIFLLSVLALAACMPAATPAPTQPPATTAPTAAPTTPPTQPPTAVPTTPPTQQPTTAPTTAPEAGIRGYAVYDRLKSEVRGYALGTNAEMFTYKVSTSTYLGTGQVQMVGDTLFYFSVKDQTVTQVNKNVSTTLNFLPKNVSLGFAVSQDGKQIAWGVDTQGQTNPGSELWIANVDGSNAKKIASIDPAANSKWQVLRPLRFLNDGRLLFTYSPTGIGGYILFDGFAGISVYDPAGGNNAITPLVAPDAGGPANMCVNNVSPDLKTAVMNCSAQTRGQIILHDLASDKLTPIPLLLEQAQAGSPVYSPSGEWLAYAAARGQMDNEAGKAAVIPAAGGQPQVIASFNNGYVRVVAWVDEDRLLLQSVQNDQGILWIINRDSSNLVKLADGFFAGTIK